MFPSIYDCFSVSWHFAMDAQVRSCIGACSIMIALYLHCVPSFAWDIASPCRHAISSTRTSVNCVAFGELDCASFFAHFGLLGRHAIFSARISVSSVSGNWIAPLLLRNISGSWVGMLFPLHVYQRTALPSGNWIVHLLLRFTSGTWVGMLFSVHVYQ